ncbi:hypothetical protein D3C77_475540 [compost metagenome]
MRESIQGDRRRQGDAAILRLLQQFAGVTQPALGDHGMGARRQVAGRNPLAKVRPRPVEGFCAQMEGHHHAVGRVPDRLAIVERLQIPALRPLEGDDLARRAAHAERLPGRRIVLDGHRRRLCALGGVQLFLRHPLGFDAARHDLLDHRNFDILGPNRTQEMAQRLARQPSRATKGRHR